MDIKTIARGVAYLALAGALLGGAIALRTEPSPTTTALDAELPHCQAIGPEAADDGACKAVWETNRRRSFESGKLYRDRVTDTVPAAPDLKEPASPLARASPKSAPQSPSTPNSNAPQPPGDIAGHPK